MEFRYYKKGQGSTIRTVTLVAAIILTLFACYSLYKYISPIDLSIGPPHPPSFWGKLLVTIPFFEFTITMGMIISTVLLGMIMFLVHLLILNNPKTVDFLIDTEIELKKVSWPPRQQHMGSSAAVIIAVIVMGTFLLFIDLILKQIMRLIRLQ